MPFCSSLERESPGEDSPGERCPGWEFGKDIDARARQKDSGLGTCSMTSEATTALNFVPGQEKIAVNASDWLPFEFTCIDTSS